MIQTHLISNRTSDGNIQREKLEFDFMHDSWPLTNNLTFRIATIFIVYNVTVSNKTLNKWSRHYLTINNIKITILINNVNNTVSRFSTKARNADLILTDYMYRVFWEKTKIFCRMTVQYKPYHKLLCFRLMSFWNCSIITTY